MKPKEGILVIIDGKVKCADREKPKPEKFRYIKGQAMTRQGIRDYGKALSKFNESCKDVVNAHESQHAMEGYPEITILKPVYQIVEPGQRVLYVPEGDKVRITLLLGGPPNSKINN